MSENSGESEPHSPNVINERAFMLDDIRDAFAKNSGVVYPYYAGDDGFVEVLSGEIEPQETDEGTSLTGIKVTIVQVITSTRQIASLQFSNRERPLNYNMRSTAQDWMRLLDSSNPSEIAWQDSFGRRLLGRAIFDAITSEQVAATLAKDELLVQRLTAEDPSANS